MDQQVENSTRSRSQFSLSPKGIILFLILLSAVLHVWGLNFGLPQALHPDEPVVVTRAQYMAATGELNPRGFHWPSGQIYLLAAEYKVWLWVGDALGAFNYADLDDVEDMDLTGRFVAHSYRSPSGYYYAGRLTTVIFAIGLVWIFYLTALRFMKEPYALTATALLILNPIVHESGRFITPDIPAEFFFIAALFFIDRLHQSLSNQSVNSENFSPIKLAFIAAILVGLGMGTKYPVAVMALPLIAVILFTPSKFKIGWKISLAVQVGFLIPVIFLITTPYALLDYPRFINDIRTIGHHVQEGHIGMQFSGSIWSESLSALLNSCGWLWTTASIIGLFAFFSNLKRTWHILLALIVALSGLSPLTVFADRYLIPVIPFLILGIPAFCSYIEKFNPGFFSVKQRLPLNVALATGDVKRIPVEFGDTTDTEVAHWKPALLLLAILLMLSTGLDGTIRLASDSRQLTLPNTRLLALEWIETYIPPGSVIVKEQGAPDLNEYEGLPLVGSPWYHVTEITPLFSREGENRDPLDILYQSRAEWVITSSNVRGRYERKGAVEQFPDLVAAFSIYYTLIDDHFDEIIRWSPGLHRAGDEIVVYKVPDGFWETVILETATVSDILDE